MRRWVFVLMGCAMGCGGATDRVEYVYLEAGVGDVEAVPCPEAGASPIVDAGTLDALDEPDLETLVASFVIPARAGMGVFQNACPASAPTLKTGDCYIVTGGALAAFASELVPGDPNALACRYENDGDAAVTIGMRIYCQ